MITIFSKIGGKYECPLIGECAPPRPSGPFVIKAGHTTKVPFRNVTTDAVDFTFAIDNPAFVLTKDADSYKAKESKDIPVKYEASKEAVTRSARLIATATSGTVVGTQWVFYISGVPPS